MALFVVRKRFFPQLQPCCPPSLFPGVSPLCRLCVTPRPPPDRDSCTVPGNAGRGGAAAGVFCNCLWPSLTQPLTADCPTAPCEVVPTLIVL